MRITASRQEICPSNTFDNPRCWAPDTAGARSAAAGRRRSARSACAGWRASRRGAPPRSICLPKATRWSAARSVAAGRNRSAESNCAESEWLLRSWRAPDRLRNSARARAVVRTAAICVRVRGPPLIRESLERGSSGAANPSPPAGTRSRRSRPRHLVGIAHGIVHHVGQYGHAHGDEAREQEGEQHDSAEPSGTPDFKPGRATSATRMELFWKLALMPASFDPAHQLFVELLVPLGFAFQRLVFEGPRVQTVIFRLGSLTAFSSFPSRSLAS